MNRLLICFTLAWAGCALTSVIPGTTLPDTRPNRAILDVLERYRHALEDRDAATLLTLAHPNYYEDSGTPKGDDDYGYDGLKQVLANQLKRVKSMRYEIEYRTINVTGAEPTKRAEVEVFLDGSFELAAEAGDRYRRVNDYHHFVLEQKGDEWKFLSGM